MKGKTVKESLGDVFRGKSQEEIGTSLDLYVEELVMMNEEDMLETLSEQAIENSWPMNPIDIACSIILNTDIEARKEAIRIVCNEYLKPWSF